MRSKKGQVVKKTDKTLNIEVHSYKLHPKYKKRYRSTKKYLVHDAENKYNVGDTLTFYETRPISKKKCWTVEEPKTTQAVDTK
ncbi:MAG: 30S ribosomal protein S17 [Candidatus Peregrinibacteria bacterium]|nr:30S ribosomal protein S17 [Candidatus Peregrinibacteria bacterium]MDZ4245421.1 30S ribosomal protein S17 [Candidatus Gracilibacteria bacterium]